MKISAAVSTLLTGLYAVYKAESNANDSLNLRNGTPYGGLTYTAGKSGNAFTFNGTNAYNDFSNNAFKLNTFSISQWLYIPTSSHSDGQCPFFNGNYKFGTSGNYYGFYFVLTSGNSFICRLTNGTTDNLVNSLSTAYTGFGQWVNVVYTYSYGVRARLYIDGVLVNSNTNTTQIVYDTTHFSEIGIFGGSTKFYPMMNNSKIDETCIWNKELTATEVTELYNAGAGKFYPY